MFRHLCMCVLAAALLACGPDAQEKAARDYAAQMTPLLQRNAALSRSFLDLAAQIKKHKASPQMVADKLQTQMIPRARSLHESAQAIQPAVSPLDGIHLGLVRAWGNRVAAYEAMHGAWVSRDLGAFEGASEDHRTVFKAEQRYFDSTQKLMAGYELTLDRYP